MRVVLTTERLILRRLTEADVDNLVELDSDPAVLRYINGGTPTPREVIRDQILPRMMAYYDRFEGFGFWAAVERSTGTLLGWFSLLPEEGEGPGVASLGYRLRQSAWGKGYGTEGAKALIRRAFTELGVQRVVATTYEHNRASRRVMEKAGMRLVRSYRSTPEQLAATGTLSPRRRMSGRGRMSTMRSRGPIGKGWRRQDQAGLTEPDSWTAAPLPAD